MWSADAAVSRDNWTWIDKEACSDGTSQKRVAVVLYGKVQCRYGRYGHIYSSPPRSLRYRKGSLLRKTPTPSLAGAFWRDYHYAELRHTRFRTTCSDADVDVLRV